ncbi:putative ribonuclease H-like domain-containing protein [Tanacetum coccineum]
MVRPPSISFMRPFGCPVTILNTLDPLGKFNRKADEGFFVGYSINSKAFRVFNTRTRKVEENLYINFLENKPNVVGSGPEWLFDIDSLTKSMNYKPATVGNQTNDNACIETNVNAGQTGQEKEFDDLRERNVKKRREKKEISNKVRKEGYANITTNSYPDVYTTGPSINTASENINTGSSNINTASPIPNDPSIQSLEATSIFDDAYDDRAEVGAEADLNNLVTTINVSYIPITRIHKGIDYDEVFAPFARIEAIRLFFAYASFMGLIMYQMNLKSAFLYGTIEEEVYVCQPLGFEDPQFPDKVYKVEKLYMVYIKLLEPGMRPCLSTY